MNIFIDTEFTDFLDLNLISIGLVASDGRSFYGEVLDFDRSKCSAFVREAVLPQLGDSLDAAMSKRQLGQAVFKWLDQFSDDNPTIGFDFVDDWALLLDLLDQDAPTWLKSRNIRGNLDNELVAQYFRDTGLRPHHALNDAQANRFAFKELGPS